MPKHDINVKKKEPARRSPFNMAKQAGFGLVESLLAVAILGSTVFMLLNGLSTGAISVGILQEDVTAQNLGRTQLEFTKSLPFNTAPFSYQSIAEIPEGYSITADAVPVSSRNSNMQRVIITVYRGVKTVYVLEGFKVNR